MDNNSCSDFKECPMELKPDKFLYRPNICIVFPSDYYIKPVADWLPNQLIPGYTPCCPKYEKSNQVSLLSAKWIT